MNGFCVCCLSGVVAVSVVLCVVFGWFCVFVVRFLGKLRFKAVFVFLCGCRLCESRVSLLLFVVCLCMWLCLRSAIGVRVSPLLAIVCVVVVVCLMCVVGCVCFVVCV